MLADDSPEQITVYLRRLSAGDPAAESQLADAVYAQMRRIAQRIIREKSPDYTLQATALVNEALMELIRYRGVEWQDRIHFFRTAARLLHRRCIDIIRSERAQKRPPRDAKVELGDLPIPAPEKYEEALTVHRELDFIATYDPALAELVEMVYFGGVSTAAVAEIRGVSERTVKRHLDIARRRIKARIKKHRPNSATDSAV